MTKCLFHSSIILNWDICFFESLSRIDQCMLSIPFTQQSKLFSGKPLFQLSYNKVFKNAQETSI